MKKGSFNENWTVRGTGIAAHPATLPHDAMQEQGRAASAPSGSGCAYFLGGEYVYEKTFTVPEEWRDQEVVLEFEGCYPTAAVALNGQAIGGCAYGYSLFRVALEGLRYGAENTVTVCADNSKTPNSRWYSGAGLYRPVWLLTGPKQHILPDGVRVTTLSYAPARILVETQTTDLDAAVTVEILDGDTVIAAGTGARVELGIPGAKLWNAEHPYLYRCRVTLDSGDTQTVSFGIRKIEWSARGFFVNGESVKLRGGCLHHDNGILGARSFRESEYRRVKKLKEFGFNAIRSAHNPACPALLDACDALGMYVMDEGWDMWTKHKNPHDYGLRFLENYDFDIRSMVGKDYNHPSVVLYSIGNEVTEPAKPEGVALAGTLAERFRALDPTRPVTAGINITLLLMADLGIDLTVNSGEKKEEPAVSSTEYNKMAQEQGQRMVQAAASDGADAISAPVFEKLDICGYNYASSRYAIEGKKTPGGSWLTARPIPRIWRKTGRRWSNTIT